MSFDRKIVVYRAICNSCSPFSNLGLLIMILPCIGYFRCTRYNIKDGPFSALPCHDEDLLQFDLIICDFFSPIFHGKEVLILSTILFTPTRFGISRSTHRLTSHAMLYSVILVQQCIERHLSA
jgi:hypothetical protein